MQRHTRSTKKGRGSTPPHRVGAVSGLSVSCSAKTYAERPTRRASSSRASDSPSRAKDTRARSRLGSSALIAAGIILFLTHESPALFITTPGCYPDQPLEARDDAAARATRPSGASQRRALEQQGLHRLRSGDPAVVGDRHPRVRCGCGREPLSFHDELEK